MNNMAIFAGLSGFNSIIVENAQIRLNSPWRGVLIGSVAPMVCGKIPQIQNESFLRHFLLLSFEFYG